MLNFMKMKISEGIINLTSERGLVRKPAVFIFAF